MDVHVLETNENGVRLVMHIAIPAGNNAAGVPIREAVARAKGGTSILPTGDGTKGTISATELADIQSGALYERVVFMERLQASNASIDAFYNRVAPETLASLQAELDFYGHVRDVP